MSENYRDMKIEDFIQNILEVKITPQQLAMIRMFEELKDSPRMLTAEPLRYFPEIKDTWTQPWSTGTTITYTDKAVHGTCCGSNDETLYMNGSGDLTVKGSISSGTCSCTSCKN